MPIKSIALALSLTGCLAEEPATSPPTASLAATTLGVTRWDVSVSGDHAVVLGRDGDDALVELAVDQIDADHIHVESAAGAFDLTSTGAIVAASDEARALAAAIYTDLGHDTRPLAITHDGELGTIASASTVSSSGSFTIGWSFFGSSGSVNIGQSCPGQVRSDADSFAFTTYGIAVCSHDWLSPSPGECRSKANFSIPGWHWDTCNWFISVR
ncbi:MAG: hypothetical protein ABI867_21390 [Kofleriaceae bacterium]